MLSEFISAIKSEKQMSFRHWRYRLLHWCFSCNPTSPETSPLPRCLYTHYCPLFHLTNLIAIFSPAILVIKIVVFLFWLVYCGVEKSIDVFSDWKIRRKEAKYAKKTNTNSTEDLRKKEIRKARLSARSAYGHEFDFWYNCISHGFDLLNREDLEKIFNEVTTKMAEELEAKAFREKKMRERITFWVNFSRIFIKGFLNLLYAALFGLVLYGMYKFGMPVLRAVWSFIIWLVAGVFSLDFILIGSKVVGISIIAVIFGVLLIHAIRLIPFGRMFGKVLPPFALVGAVVVAFFKYTAEAFCNFADFIKMFYEENCPPITIVNAIAEEEEEEWESS